MKTDKTKPSRDAQFPLNDAKLAIDISAVRDQVSQLCSQLRYDSRDKPQAVLALLSDAQRLLGDALGCALTVEKS
jgi:hypothetical protein